VYKGLPELLRYSLWIAVEVDDVEADTSLRKIPIY
jgi:hypothetical protein